MVDKVTAFQALLLEEQDAIRSLSFGQFTSVTMRKTQLLDEMRELEQQRRNEATLSGSYGSPPSLKQQEADLVAAIGQRSPQSAALYSSSGAAVAGNGGRVRAKG